ncbi:hypothetical protein WMY93_028411 [Mugilogobius chulae]|uniref:Uncharacterized protein n=1 Tax=Mugilogobius chulae TaxID=88201 RepID=A0AAW0MSV3_9GOBI
MKKLMEEQRVKFQQELDLKEKENTQNLREISREHKQKVGTLWADYRDAMNEAKILAHMVKESDKEVCDLKKEIQTLKETCQKSAEEEMKKLMEEQRVKFQQELDLKEKENTQILQEMSREHKQKRCHERYESSGTHGELRDEDICDLKKENQTLKESRQKSAEEIAMTKRRMEEQSVQFQQELGEKQEEIEQLRINLKKNHEENEQDVCELKKKHQEAIMRVKHEMQQCRLECNVREKLLKEACQRSGKEVRAMSRQEIHSERQTMYSKFEEYKKEKTEVLEEQKIKLQRIMEERDQLQEKVKELQKKLFTEIIQEAGEAQQQGRSFFSRSKSC